MKGGDTMDDLQIIELYFKRDQQAISESSIKYGRYCHTIARNILVSEEDAEECVSDTWMKSWQAMPPQRPSCLKLFFARITRNLSFNRRRALSSEKRGGGSLPLVLEELKECLADRESVETQVEAKALGEAINTFLEILPSRERSVFLRRYFYTESFGQIADRYGLREANVRLILSRTRKKLKDFLEKEGYFDEN
jgi:RNA polymerase sigma-70 factor (ECF subfamily)